MDVLTKYITNKKNSELIDKYIRRSEYPSDALDNVLGMLYLYRNESEKEKVLKIIDCLYNKKIGWKHPLYQSFQQKQEEVDYFMETPFEVEEGVIECLKCNGKYTFSYQRQTRSADEMSTTFSQCMTCGNKWRNG